MKPKHANAPTPDATDARNNATYIQNVADITEFYLAQLLTELHSRYPRPGVIQLKNELLKAQAQALVETRCPCDPRLHPYLEFLDVIDRLDERQAATLRAELAPVSPITVEKLAEVLHSHPKKSSGMRPTPRKP